MFKFFENSTILFYSTAKIRFSDYQLSSIKWLVLYSAIFITYWKISLKNITTLISFHLFFFSFLSRFIYNCINFCNWRMIIRIVPFAFYIQKKKFFFLLHFVFPFAFHSERNLTPTTLGFYDVVLSLRRKYVDTLFHDYNNIELPGLIIIPIPHKCSITFLHKNVFLFVQKLLDKLATFPLSLRIKMWCKQNTILLVKIR